MEQEVTFEHFADLYEIPYTVVTILYIVALLLISFIVAARKVSIKCKCCKSCCTALIKSKLAKKVDKFNTWLVRLIFGKSEGISEDQRMPVQAEEDNGVTTVYLQGHKMSKLDVNILGTIVLCFSLLMAIAAYTVYMLEVSHTCSEDTAIYCFPRFINSDNAANSPNLTVADMEYPITDCSIWVNSTIAPLITFQCFRYVYNGQAALATAGGLLALFTVAMRITVTIFLKVFNALESCGACLLVLQITAAIILILVNAGIAVVILAFQLSAQLEMLEAGASPVAQRISTYLSENGLQLLVITGTATLLLLIDWRKYVVTSKKSTNDMEMKDLK